MNLRRTTLLAIAIAGLTGASVAIAERPSWCAGGTVVNVADVQWNHAQLLNQTQNISVPPYTSNPDYYQAFHAANNHCQTYAGGAGPSLGVADNGSVTFEVYAPWSYLHTINYQLSHGLSFECNKCYAIPPLVRRREAFAPAFP